MTLKVNKKKRRAKIQHILEIAKSVFAEKGYVAARIDEIAERAKISKISMYYYIGNKEALYDLVVEDLLTDVEKYVSRILNTEESPEANMKKFVSSIAQIAEKNHELHAILLRELISGGDKMPSRLPAALAENISVIKNILDSGRKQKVFSNEDPLILFFILLSFFVYWRLHLPLLKKISPENKFVDNHSGAISNKVINYISKLLLKMTKS